VGISGEEETYADDGDLGDVVGRHVGERCKREEEVVVGEESESM